MAVDPALQAVSPFALRLVPKDGGYDVLLSNRTKKPQLYLLRPDRRPLTLLVRDAKDKPCKVTAKSGDGPVYFAHYKRIEAEREFVVGHISVGGSDVDLYHVALGEQRCDYLPKGRYFASALWWSTNAACTDCTVAQWKELNQIWTGAIRSNEIEIRN